MKNETKTVISYKYHGCAMHVRYLHGFTSFAKTLKSLCLLKGVELD
jgi:hypothetical protein